MSNQPSPETPIQITYYAVLYMDVLGQREKLAKIVDLPRNPQEHESFFQLLEDTYGVVDRYAEWFELYLAETTTELPAEIPEHFCVEYQRMVGQPIERVLFSDSMLYFISLNEQEGAVPTIRLHDLLRAAASICAGGLAAGNPARGGLDIGVAANFPRIGIYGPALYNSYALENDVAQYPRVVIGPTLKHYLVESSKDPTQTKEAALRRSFARKCLELIYEDKDGVAAIDYAGKAMRDMYPGFKEIIMRATDFAIRELNRFRQEGNEKLTSRYSSLADYLQERARAFWQ
jgi:hypothetical protein